jgi:hypothetical protein
MTMPDYPTYKMFKDKVMLAITGSLEFDRDEMNRQALSDKADSWADNGEGNENQGGYGEGENGYDSFDGEGEDYGYGYGEGEGEDYGEDWGEGESNNNFSDESGSEPVEVHQASGSMLRNTSNRS